MSEESKKAREAMKSKAKRLASADPHQKVDSSTWTPGEPINADIKTGMRPISKRAFKKGGKVLGHAEGHKSEHRADRKPRKEGGKAMSVDGFLNRDQKMANEERDGIKHIGGLKAGGRAEKCGGGRTPKFGGGPIGSNPLSDQARMMGQAAGMRKHGGKVHKNDGGPTGKNRPNPAREALRRAVARGKPIDWDEIAPAPYALAVRNQEEKESKTPLLPSDDIKRAKGGKAKHPDVAEDKKLIKKMVKPEARTGRKHGGNVFSGDSLTKIPGAVGGRSAHAHGGKAKGKTNINIIISSGRKDGAEGIPPNAPVNPPRPPAVPMPMPMPPAGGGMPMGAAPPMGGAMPPQMPRKSGGRTNYPIRDGAGGGEGRLEKIKAYGP